MRKLEITVQFRHFQPKHRNNWQLITPKTSIDYKKMCPMNEYRLENLKPKISKNRPKTDLKLKNIDQIKWCFEQNTI